MPVQSNALGMLGDTLRYCVILGPAICYSAGVSDTPFHSGATDMLRYRDFVPKRTAATFLKFKPEFESFDDAVMAANDWIHEEAVDVFSLETVVLPGVGDSDEASQSASAMPLAEAGQFLRVWYRAAM